jgi:hypothetical protein
MTSASLVHNIQSAITDEIFFAFGLNRRGVMRRSLGWAFALSTRRFATYMAEVDEAMAASGSPAGCRVMMDALDVDIEARGQSNIPTSGPALLLANHPGAYDSMAIGSLIPRPDLHVIATKTRLYQAMPHLRQYVHMVVKGHASENMVALRSALDHIQRGGILLQFGSGRIEPDPSTDPIDDNVFAKWSPSLEIILRKVPGLVVVPTISSHVLLKRFRDSILAKLRKPGLDRRRLAEFIQILQQLAFPRSVKAQAKISFGTPFRLGDLQLEKGDRRVFPAVIEKIREEIKGHLAWVGRHRADDEG